MIVETQKPVFKAVCDACGATTQLESSVTNPKCSAEQGAHEAGYTIIVLSIKTATYIHSWPSNGDKTLLLCPMCLMALASVLSKKTEELFTEWTQFHPDQIQKLSPTFSAAKEKLANEAGFESVSIYAGMKGPARPPEVHVTHMPKGTIGLPATTVAKLQSVAMEEGCHGPEEQAALRRLLSQEGTIEDIGLLRAIATLAKINLPAEAQLRNLDSMHEELRQNA